MTILAAPWPTPPPGDPVLIRLVATRGRRRLTMRADPTGRYVAALVAAGWSVVVEVSR